MTTQDSILADAAIRAEVVRVNSRGLVITERGNIVAPELRAVLGMATHLTPDGWVVVGRWTEGQLHVIGVVRYDYDRAVDNTPVRPVAEQAAALGLTLREGGPDKIWSGVLP